MEFHSKLKIGDIFFRKSTRYNDTHHYYGKISKVVEEKGMDQIQDEDGTTHLRSSLRHATKEEIKTYKTMKIEQQPSTSSRTKKAFHTFELDKRKITIGVLGQGDDVLVGHSICHPDDEFDKELSRKISIGRAESKNRLSIYTMDGELTQDYGVLKSIAHRWERNIKEDPTIVGVYQNGKK